MIRLLALDCDGVLTDGGLWYGPAGEELKRFDVRDGLGIRQLIEAGVQVALVTGRGNRALEIRAQELGIAIVRTRVGDKRAALAAIQAETGIGPDETAAMGDDVPDLGLFALAALTFAPADAEPEILAAAGHVTARAGGRGAVRDAAHHILAHNGVAASEIWR